MKRPPLFVLLIVFAAAGAWWCFHAYTAPGPLAAEKTLIFKKGAGFSGISDELAGEGAIAHPLVFKAVALASGSAAHFKAGEYSIPAGSSIKDIIALLASGKVVIHKITIAEGLTVQEIFALLKAEAILSGDVPANIHEGSLLPETYYFIYGDTRAEVIHRMQKSMHEVLAAAWEKRKPGLPLANPDEALTLASIVEKETGVKTERGLVASVYINRLNKHMLLQADPTVVYGITHGADEKHMLSRDDLHTPTPYNTYMNPGLPPTPIANPGKASIEATLNPPDTNFLYFVATGNGGHYFASSMKEHNKNVAEYRKAMRQSKIN